jgi:spermidine/putrescine-binding protein
VRAKVMEAYNGKKLNTGYLRANPKEIAAVNKLRTQVMAVYETSASSAESMIRNGEIDAALVNDIYEYKVNGKIPEVKKNGRKK